MWGVEGGVVAEVDVLAEEEVTILGVSRGVMILGKASFRGLTRG